VLNGVAASGSRFTAFFLLLLTIDDQSHAIAAFGVVGVDVFSIFVYPLTGTLHRRGYTVTKSNDLCPRSPAVFMGDGFRGTGRTGSLKPVC